MYRMLFNRTQRALALLLAACMLLCISCDARPEDPSSGVSSAVVSEVSSEAVSESAVSSETVSSSEASETIEKGVERFTYTYSEEDEKGLRAQLAELNGMLSDGCEFDSFNELELAAEDAYTHLATQASIANLLHYMDLNSEEANENYLYSSGLQSDLGREFILLYKRVYDSSLKEQFFADWTEKDIEEMLHLAETYTEKVVALLDQYDEIKVEYGGYDSESESFAGDVASLYHRQIDVLNQLAREMGYGDFYEYAYPNEYERDYSLDQVAQFRMLVRKYLPRLIQAMSRDIDAKSAKFSAGEIRQLNSILFGDMNRYQLVNRGKTFYEKIGGANEEIYLSSLLEEENFTLCDGSKSLEGAFTMYLEEYETPVIYYGPGYHNVFTFLHESGHYCAFVLSNEGSSDTADDMVSVSNDLCEIHSQGAEWLYLSMISGDYSEELYEFIVEYRLFCDLTEVLFCTAIDAFEERCYKETPDPDEYDEIMKAVCDELGGYDFLCSVMGMTPCEYWRLVTVENPVYYISYPVSMLPSIELFLKAQEDPDAAIGQYKALFGPDCVEFLPTLENAGLSTPFEKDFYESVSAYINQKLLG